MEMKPCRHQTSYPVVRLDKKMQFWCKYCNRYVTRKNDNANTKTEK